MKRQDSLPSSSSHHENAAEKLHAKAVGCMSGFFHFVSGSHSRRKFLTFGKKQEKNQRSKSTTEKTKNSSSPKIECNNSPPLLVKGDNKAKDQGNKTTVNVLQRLSCEVPRSPTLPAEIRRSNSVNSPESFRDPPALMARLMGLEEAPAATSKALPVRSPSTNSTALVPSEYSAAADQKRRQLVGALEKCDRDLKALKKIIDAVRSADGLSPMPTAVFGKPEGGGAYHAGVGKRSHGVKCLEVNNNVAEQPSPVSVLDEFMTRSLSSYQYSKRQSYNYGRVQHHVRQQKKTKPGEEDVMISPSIFDRLTCESLQRTPVLSADLHYRKPVSFDSISADLVAASLSPPPSSLPSPLWSSKAMKETVEEVCKDIAWGEKREIGRIGLALQDHIYRDLIEEIVIDLGSLHSYNNVNYPLPFEACKRRLCF